MYNMYMYVTVFAKPTFHTKRGVAGIYPPEFTKFNTDYYQSA